MLKSCLEDELIDVARELADVARVETLKHFRSPGLAVQNKLADGWDPVTAADRDSETAMRRVLARRRPDDSIIGEEFGSAEGTTGFVWVLDPVDGTRSYVSGNPVWGTLIAVSNEDGSLYGIIDQPYVGDRFEGGFGRSIMRGPHGRGETKVSETKHLSDAIIFTTFPEVGSDFERAAFQRLASKTKLTRYGADCYAYALLAGGYIDLVVEAGLNSYDLHAPIAVVQAAGGLATDWSGGPAHGGGRFLAAATPELHASAMAELV